MIAHTFAKNVTAFSYKCFYRHLTWASHYINEYLNYKSWSLFIFHEAPSFIIHTFFFLYWWKAERFMSWFELFSFFFFLCRKIKHEVFSSRAWEKKLFLTWWFLVILNLISREYYSWHLKDKLFSFLCWTKDLILFG